ncbi:hypothetical protein GCM10007888_17880 [Methylobacterium oxalidis]|uniref:Uncharacterized protein n=1 Tax=Methylobacterium oxalidis TaxID=944322 RepID=A0ABQ6DFZ4_9HYPH|nr:hypothetical protein GCM10007888_17880 [Methylobacterium oxalidis]
MEDGALLAVRVVEDLDPLDRIAGLVGALAVLNELDEELVLLRRRVGRHGVGDVRVEEDARLERVEDQPVAVEHPVRLRLEAHDELALGGTVGARRVLDRLRPVAAAKQRPPEAFRLERKSHPTLSSRKARAEKRTRGA